MKENGHSQGNGGSGMVKAVAKVVALQAGGDR